MAMEKDTKSMHAPRLTEDYIVPNAGLALIGRMLCESQFCAIFDAALADMRKDKRSKPQFSDGEIAMVYAMSIANGSTIYDAVDELSPEALFIADALGIDQERIPSAETIRQRLDSLASCPRLIEQLANASISLIRRYGCVPTGIELANGMIPLDFDVTPMDNSKTKKEGVNRTYKNFDGYAPMMAYIGAEGYLIEAELREGKAHSQRRTLDLLKRVVERARHLTTDPLLVRMDSGNDAAENISFLLARLNMGDPVSFIIKRNLRRESLESWYELAKRETQPECPREGKLVYTGSTYKPMRITYPDGYQETQEVRIVYQVTARTIDAKTGQGYLIPQLEVDTYWTDTDLSDDDVIELYHDHGTMEQFHSELKTDMDVERLPSGKFATNALVLAISAFVYNLERMIGQETLQIEEAPLKKPAHRRRLRTVLLGLIRLPGKLVSHARDLILKVSEHCAWSRAFLCLMDRFAHANRFTRPVCV